MANTDSIKPHLSASQLETYWRCPQQYYRRYICGEIIPPGIAMLTGTGYHRGIEANMRQKIETHRDLPAKEIADIAVAAFETAAAGGYTLTPDESPAAIGEAKDDVATMAVFHATEQAPDYQPIQVEAAKRLVLPNASRDLVGIIDLVDNQGRIVDFKSANRRKSQQEADASTQLSVYAAAYHVETGELPAEVRLDVVVKNKSPVRQVLVSSRTERDFEVLCNRINVTLDAIEKGAFPPCSPDSYVCSRRFCGYSFNCPYFSGKE